MPKRQKVSRPAAETMKVASLDAGYHDTTRRVASLLVVQGSEIDLGRLILVDQPITIGRDESVELPLADGSISRRHCLIDRDADTGRYVLVDLGSTNGTRVNGSPIAGKVPLAAMDKIFLGASVVRFGYADRLDLEYQSRVEEMVTTDSLTGMTSMRQYNASFAVAMDKAASRRSSLAVLVMDMDGLKQINDTHGHEMGGFAIVEVSAIIRDVLDPVGKVCRFGGDEFVAFLPGIERERAAELAEQVRAAVAAAHPVKDGVRLAPTISIGVAVYPRDVDHPEQLFTAADKAMYRAKRDGGNRVCS